jgi:hypothetical protein
MITDAGPAIDSVLPTPCTLAPASFKSPNKPNQNKDSAS